MQKLLTRSQTPDLAELLHNQPTYPGVSIHMCTPDFEQELSKIVGIKFSHSLPEGV